MVRLEDMSRMHGHIQLYYTGWQLEVDNNNYDWPNVFTPYGVQTDNSLWWRLPDNDDRDNNELYTHDEEG